MLRACLVGFGRTGRVIAEEIFNCDDVKLVGIFKKREDKLIGCDIGTYMVRKKQDTESIIFLIWKKTYRKLIRMCSLTSHILKLCSITLKQ